jgi:eukaryotic-like serine/threonine-protein kinase
VKACLNADPSSRPSSDDLVSKCEAICYPDTNREFGNVKQFDNGYWGFISADQGDDVFFHIECVFGSEKPKKGERVWFARHRGGGADRAFPVMKVISQSTLF